MECQNLGLLLLHVVVYFHSGECLRCYSCPLTSTTTTSSANINCLANSTEITCAVGQDRCYSVTSGSSDVRVEKGCTRSARCQGNRICCSQDFCNGGQGSARQTGIDKACADVNECVQGGEDMTCSARSPRDVTRVCRCTESRYNIGAVCRPMSRVGGQCFRDTHCLLYNSFCEYNLCRCGDFFFANETLCQLKMELSAPCTNSSQCRPLNSECVAGFCTCKPGYDTHKEAGVCAGSHLRFSLVLLMISAASLWIQNL